jgi:hypothetical protein
MTAKLISKLELVKKITDTEVLYNVQDPFPVFFNVARFEVLSAMLLKCQAFWFVTPVSTGS